MNTAITRRATRGMRREWRLHALAIFSLSVSFVCLAAALLVVTNVQALSDRWQQTSQLTVYLKEGSPSEQVTQLRTAVAKVTGVATVEYVSSTQAHAEFSAKEAKAQDDAKNELLALPVEAFPASLEIRLAADMSRPSLDALVRQLGQFPIVDEVETYERWTERLGGLVSKGVLASLGFSLIVLLSVLAIVGSTIRLVLHRRKSEVEVLRLVGATNSFVKGPFLLEGGAQGALSAFIALAVVAGLFFIARARLHETIVPFFGVELTFLPWPVAILLVVFGGLLGSFAANLGLRKLVTV